MPSPVNADAAMAVMRQVGVEPKVPYPGARPPWPCRCIACGRDVAPSYDNVRKGLSSGCKWCAVGMRASTRRMRSTEAATDLAVERGLEPLEPYPGLCTPWRCRCMGCGAEVNPRFTALKKGQGGCRTCGIVVRAAKQRGSEAAAVADLQAAGFDPLEDFPGVMNPWRCRCRSCGKALSKMLNAVRNGSAGCKWCLRLIVDPGAALEVMRAADLEPLTPYPGSDSPWSCRCLRCLRTVSPRYGSVSSGQGGCRWCAKNGFKASEEAVVYLIENRDLGAVKVGVADTKGTRLKRHGQRGWQALAVVQVPGERAVVIEKDILSWWRTDLRLPPYLSKTEMPQFGWTETVDADAIDIPTTIARIRVLAAAGQATRPQVA